MGVLQGITEWLPIISSGQVMLTMMNFFGLNADEAFSLAIYLHIGTLMAVVVKLRDDIFKIIASLPDFRREQLILFLTISTIFTAIVGIPVYKLLKENFAGWQGDVVPAVIGFFFDFNRNHFEIFL